MFNHSSQQDHKAIINAYRLLSKRIGALEVSFMKECWDEHNAIPGYERDGAYRTNEKSF